MGLPPLDFFTNGLVDSFSLVAFIEKKKKKLMIGKFGVSACYAIIYVYGSELVPTTARAVAVGFFSQGGRIGGIIAPFVVYLGEYNSSIPFVIFGTFGILAGFLCFLLPETKGKSLPNFVG